MYNIALPFFCPSVYASVNSTGTPPPVRKQSNFGKIKKKHNWIIAGIPAHSHGAVCGPCMYNIHTTHTHVYKPVYSLQIIENPVRKALLNSCVNKMMKYKSALLFSLFVIIALHSIKRFTTHFNSKDILLL